MPASLLIAASIASLVVGAPLSIAVVLVLFVISPWLGVGAVVVVWFHAWWVRRRRSGESSSSEAHLFRTLSADVTTGSTLRQAIAGSTSGLVSDETRRLCAAGVPMEDVAASLETSLGSSSGTFVGLCRVSELTGASICRSLLLMAELAEGEEELERNKRSAVAQSRFSAGVVGILPLGVGIVVLLLRGVPEPGGAVIVLPIVIGATMMLSGSALVWLISSRAVTA